MDQDRTGGWVVIVYIVAFVILLLVLMAIFKIGRILQ
jgi:hypothetical protein